MFFFLIKIKMWWNMKYQITLKDLIHSVIVESRKTILLFALSLKIMRRLLIL